MNYHNKNLLTVDEFNILQEIKDHVIFFMENDLCRYFLKHFIVCVDSSNFYIGDKKVSLIKAQNHILSFEDLMTCHAGAISLWFEYKNLNQIHQNLSEIKSLMHFK